MTFPLTLGGHTFRTPAALGAAVQADIEAGGGTLAPNTTPTRWLLDRRAASELPDALLTGLAAALIRSGGPGAVAEGARLALALDSAPLGELLGLAITARDLGVLLHPDPFATDRSVEDTVLDAWSRLADAADPAVRGPLLEHLRNAGLPHRELTILLAHGTDEELTRWLPAILAEAPDERLLATLGEALEGPGGERLRRHVDASTPP